MTKNRYKLFTEGVKVEVDQAYLNDEASGGNATPTAIVIQSPQDDEELVMIQYENGGVDYLGQEWIRPIGRGRYGKGGGIGEAEWLVILEDKDGFEIDEIVFAKTEDEAYHKAELLHKGSKSQGINMLTDKNGKKIKYAHGGTTPTAWKRFLNWLNEKI